MDLQGSDNTSALALRSALADFSAHPGLPLLTTACMALRHREALDQGHTATADTLVRLAVSDAAAGMVEEFNRRVRKRGSQLLGHFRRPTFLVELWRNPRSRPGVQRLLRDALPDVKWQHVRAWLQHAADHERQHREVLIANLLIRLAVLATQPDERAVARVAGQGRAFVTERDVAELLRARGHLDQAALHTRRALFHLCYAHELAREWAPDPHVLIREVRGALSWQLGFLGYGIAADLVQAALNQPVSRGQARYASKSLSK